MLGYDIDEDNRDFKKEGITGKVEQFSTVNIEYPCIIVNSVKQYQLQVIKQMTVTSMTYDENIEKISLYFTNGTDTVILGKIFSNQVKAILELFSSENSEIIGYADKDTKLEGMYLYTLCD